MNGLQKKQQTHTHWQFAGDMEDKNKNTWRWMRKSDLNGCTEALICSAQE